MLVFQQIQRVSETFRNVIFPSKCLVDYLMASRLVISEYHKWLSGMSLPPDIGQADKDIYEALRTAWDAVKSSHCDR